MQHQQWQCPKDPTHPVTTPNEFGWSRCLECRSTPTYAERAQAAKQAQVSLGVYVPVAPCHGIGPRSAIVGLPGNDGLISISYEGNLYGSCTRPTADGTWAAAMLHAADRLVTCYPTIARAVLPADNLVQIGTYDVATARIDVTDQAALDAWLA